MTDPTHRQLHADRPPLADVPAVYFVAPTLENIRRVAEDLGRGLYESTYLNFTSPLPRNLLEEFASLVAANGTVELVEQVFDQYLDFIVLEPSLFSISPALATPVYPSDAPFPPQGGTAPPQAGPSKSTYE
jgi:hypothetical protein